MRLGISSGVLFDELESAIKILREWQEEVKRGVPNVDVSSNNEELTNFLRNFCGEMLVVSDKCASLANRILTEPGE